MIHKSIKKQAHHVLLKLWFVVDENVAYLIEALILAVIWVDVEDKY